MKECEYLDTCIFFNDKMVNMPAISNVYKKKYCKGDHSVCARYMVLKALGREKVPADLFPNQVDHAEYLINTAKSNDRE